MKQNLKVMEWKDNDRLKRRLEDNNNVIEDLNFVDESSCNSVSKVLLECVTFSVCIAFFFPCNFFSLFSVMPTFFLYQDKYFMMLCFLFFHQFRMCKMQFTRDCEYYLYVCKFQL